MSVEIVSNVDGAILGATAGMKRMILETAIKVAAQAKELAPFNLGQLKGSIMWVAGNQESDFIGPRIIYTGIDRFNRITGAVGTAVEYGIYQEFGTRRMGANPFLRPAILIVTKGASYQSAINTFATVEMEKNLNKKQRRYSV